MTRPEVGVQLSLKEAAARLGQTQRQVRYLVKQGKLPAAKVAGRWLIDEAALPRDPAAQQRRQARAQALSTAVDEALAPHVATGGYSVRSI